MDSARERLITDNMRLVGHMAKKFLYTEIEYDDIVSIGYIGLIHAADKFDESRSASFSTFACNCIAQSILMEARKVRKRNQLRIISIDTIMYKNDDGSTLTLADMLPCEETGYGEIENADWLRSLKETDRLSRKERNVLFLWLNGCRQEDIAEKMGLSQSYVSRLVRKGSRKLYESNLVEGGKSYGCNGYMRNSHRNLRVPGNNAV